MYTNIATARTWGGEAEGEWRFLPRWTLSSSLSGTVGEITSRSAIKTIYSIDADKVPLELVPPFKGRGAVRYNDGRGRFWVEAATRYSWRTNRLPPPIPGVGQLSTFKKEYIVGDLTAGTKLPTGQRLVLGVRNFTNRLYQPALASVEDPGISFVGSLTTSF
jgi:outer membrane receptor protein involved in Fe transport